MKKWIVFLFVGFLFGQTNVSPGEGTLSQAIAAAEDGETLLLVPNGEYTESDSTKVGKITGKSLTIEVDGDGSERAVVRLLTEFVDGSTNPEFFVLGDSASLTLRGIEFDGSLNGTANAQKFINFNVGDIPARTFVKKIEIDNCYIHDLYCETADDGGVIASGSSDHWGKLIVDSTFINNSVFDQTGTIVYYKKAGAHYVELKNSTMSNIKSYGFRICGDYETGWFTEDHTPTVVIDRTTWYNIGTSDGREILLLEKGPNRHPWTVTNSIFAKQVNTTKTVINLKENPGPNSTDDSLSTITNISWWSVGPINFRSHTVSDTVNIDPGFADADNGDFTLPTGSSLLTFANDGGAIGDPRWAPEVVSVAHERMLIADQFSLSQNYPNPFNPTTMISFDLEKSAFASLKVYDMLGQEIAVLESAVLEPGTHKYNFNGKGLSSGIYFYQLQTGEYSLTKKMILVK